MTELDYLLRERECILEYDAGLSREEAERRAWLEVYGEEKPNV